MENSNESMTKKPTIILTAALLCVLSPISFAKPLKVFILAGWASLRVLFHPHLRKRDLFMHGHRIFFRRRFRC
jgi:hypothetical protein